VVFVKFVAPNPRLIHHADALAIDQLCKATDVMAPLPDARVAAWAQALANVEPAQCRDIFDALAIGQGVEQRELDQEFNRVANRLSQDRLQHRCIRAGIHRHWMSCAQEAMNSTNATHQQPLYGIRGPPTGPQFDEAAHIDFRSNRVKQLLV